MEQWQQWMHSVRAFPKLQQRLVFSGVLSSGQGGKCSLTDDVGHETDSRVRGDLAENAGGVEEEEGGLNCRSATRPQNNTLPL